MKRWILAGLLVLIMAGTVQADPLGALGDRWRWWEDPKIRQEVGLTEEQVAAIQELVRSKRDQLIDLRGAMEKKGLLLADEVDRPDFDATRALSAADELMKARDELARARMALLLEIRGQLKQEQFFKLRALGKERRRHFPRRFVHEGGGPPEGPHD